MNEMLPADSSKDFPDSNWVMPERPGYDKYGYREATDAEVAANTQGLQEVRRESEKVDIGPGSSYADAYVKDGPVARISRESLYQEPTSDTSRDN